MTSGADAGSIGGSSSSEQGFLNSSCTSSTGSRGAAPSPNGARQWRPDAPWPRDVSGDRASEIDPYSSEESFQCDALASAGLGQSINLAGLPDGMLERIYGFCPHYVVPHLSVCRRFDAALRHADTVWLCPQANARPAQPPAAELPPKQKRDGDAQQASPGRTSTSMEP